MKIYFAGSITGGRGDAALYSEIIEHLKKHGEVLTEHIGDHALTSMGEVESTDTFVHDRDMEWVMASDVVIAEITQPSLGVGYEIGRSVAEKKNILCLYRVVDGKKVSRMVTGSHGVLAQQYETIEDAKALIDAFCKKVVSQS